VGVRLFNGSTLDVDVAWKDLDSARSGALVAHAGHDRFFTVDAGDGGPHHVRVTAGPLTLEATGATRHCAGQITVTGASAATRPAARGQT
jgi:hypothetical protein